LSGAALNELLNSPDSPVRGGAVEVRPDNQIIFRQGIVRATVTLPNTVEVGASPRITLSLASVMVGLALKAFLRQAYIEVRGRYVTIHLADVPALESLRAVWPSVRRVELATEREGVRMRVVFIVSEGVDA
jgi:hypothetical protein